MPIVDSYAEGNNNTALVLDDESSSYSRVGQAFTGDGQMLGSVEWYMLNASGGATGTVTAKIYASTGTFGTDARPTGSPLAISDTVLDVSTLTPSFPKLFYEFLFTGANAITLINGTKYIATLERVTGLAVPAVEVGADDSSPTHPGNDVIYLGGTWYGGALGADLIFNVNGGTAGHPTRIRFGGVPGMGQGQSIGRSW